MFEISQKLYETWFNKKIKTFELANTVKLNIFKNQII